MGVENAADRSDRGTDRDQAADARDAAAEDADRKANERDQEASKRDLVALDAAQVRRDSAHARELLRLAEEQRWANQAHILDVEARLEQAMVDLQVAQSRAASAERELREVLDQDRAEDHDASIEREAAAEDRDTAADDRRWAALDRRSAAADRRASRDDAEQREVEQNLVVNNDPDTTPRA